LAVYIAELAVVTSKADLKPKTKPRIMDLVKEAGVNVSEWESSPSGAINRERVFEIAILPESDLTALGLGEPNNRYMMESRAGPL
jgi:hypothetical protein